MKHVKSLYFSAASFLFWINRGIYLGIIASALYYFDQFAGEFNLLYPVAPYLVPVTLAGLAAYELGVWTGWRVKTPKYFRRWDWFRSQTATVPTLLWMIAVAMSLLLFAVQGVPLFGDPNSRASLGSGLGVLKRFMTVFLPVSTLELCAYYLSVYPRSRFGGWKPLVFVAVNLSILLLLTAKAPFFFFAVFLLIIYIKYRPISTKNLLRSILGTLRLFPLFILLGLVVTLYAVYAADLPFLKLLTLRLTNLVAQMPNYILLGLPGVPSRSELLLNYLASVLATLRFPLLPVHNMEQELSSVILDRTLTAGGLSPTVVGEGWILGGAVGVILLSMIFGYLSGLFVKRAIHSERPMETAVYIYAAFIIFYAIQFFSVAVFLDMGLSLVAYVIVHSMLYRMLKQANRVLPIYTLHETRSR